MTGLADSCVMTSRRSLRNKLSNAATGCHGPRLSWDASCRARSRPEQPTQAAHIPARVVSAARSQMRRDWLLVGSDIRLRAGVLSPWPRGRQPTMTAEVFQSRWCHEEVLCSRPAEVTEPHTHALDGCTSSAATAMSLPGLLIGTPPWTLNRRWYDNSLHCALSA